MERKHVFVVDTPRGEVKIQTNDLADLQRNGWFDWLFGSVPTSEVRQREEGADEEYEVDEEDLEKEIERRAYEKAKELANAYIENMENKRREEVARQRYAEQQAAQAQSAAAAQQASQVSPPVQAGGNGVASQGFIDVPPDRMTNEMWASLTPEQRRQYADRYMKNG
jgi:hypothetical protein